MVCRRRSTQVTGPNRQPLRPLNRERHWLMLTVSLRSRAQALRAQSDVVIHDVTSRGPEPWVRFSPFFPHGGIPVPFTAGRTAMSVEGIWQGLKVFASADVDESKFD